MQQIDDTVGVMRENINKVSQRGERLDSLQDKTDNLAVSAQGFRRGANRVRKAVCQSETRDSIILGLANHSTPDVVEGHAYAHVYHRSCCHHSPDYHRGAK